MTTGAADHEEFPEELETEALRLSGLPPEQARPLLRRLVAEHPAHADLIEALSGMALADPAAQSAELILGRRDKLPDGFTQRIVQRKGWAGLSEVDHVRDALDELVECGYLRKVPSDKSITGGRPSWSYFWSPLIKAK